MKELASKLNHNNMQLTGTCAMRFKVHDLLVSIATFTSNAFSLLASLKKGEFCKRQMTQFFCSDAVEVDEVFDWWNVEKWKPWMLWQSTPASTLSLIVITMDMNVCWEERLLKILLGRLCRAWIFHSLVRKKNIEPAFNLKIFPARMIKVVNEWNPHWWKVLAGQSSS